MGGSFAEVFDGGGTEDAAAEHFGMEFLEVVVEEFGLAADMSFHFASALFAAGEIAREIEEPPVGGDVVHGRSRRLRFQEDAAVPIVVPTPPVMLSAH